jgi:DNA-directed RNA polymerase subunit K/omega
MENLTDQPDEDINIIMQNYKVNKKNYKTSDTLTKYEKTRILSERASQINDGSQILIKNAKYDNAYDIALAEFNAKKIPFIIKRPYGNTFEYWKITDLY